MIRLHPNFAEVFGSVMSNPTAPRLIATITYPTGNPGGTRPGTSAHNAPATSRTGRSPKRSPGEANPCHGKVTSLVRRVGVGVPPNATIRDLLHHSRFEPLAIAATSCVVTCFPSWRTLAGPVWFWAEQLPGVRGSGRAECSRCGGFGGRRCRERLGSGVDPYDDRRRCHTCGGARNEDCATCHGSSVEPCLQCLGVSDCTSCGGSDWM